MKVSPNPSNSRRTSDSGAPFAGARGPSDADFAEQSWAGEFGELSEYANHYFAARADLWKVRGSKLTWNVATGVLAGAIGVALLAVAAARLVGGIAGGLTVLFGGRAWAGDLLAGVAVLAVAGAGFFFIRLQAERARRRGIFEKYARRHEHQTERFGHDMSDRAAG